MFIKKDKPPSVTIWCLLAETQKEIILLMVIAKRRNDCVDKAIKQKNEALSEIKDKPPSVTIWCLLAETQKEIILLMVIAKRRNDYPNYEVTYTLKDLNRVKDHLDLIKHHVWILNALESTPRNSTRRTVHRLTLEEREQRKQRYQQRRLERQIQRENQNPVTVRLSASNSTTTSPSATVGTFGTTPRHRCRSNETPQSFSQAVSPRRSPEQVTSHFNLLNQQLAEAHLTASDSSDSSDTDTEDEMANAVLDYLEDNLHNHTSLQVDPFGTQDPLQWMIHFEKVARSNAWNKAKKIRKYATYLEDDAEEWHDEINANDMADWAAWRAGFIEKYCNTRWKNKWLQLLPHIAPLITMQAPATLAAALEKAQAYEEGLDMVNEIEPRKQKGKKKVIKSSDEEDEEEEEERKLKKMIKLVIQKRIINIYI
ncbi:hypothetical protein Glove_174g13 [Diversispora epigaea]|uniref:Retrotransposon gag domain-containing protein n=1 Tax=Diversispora epigaea TaxID=1348612 RepID=A0A397IXT9_9GLOM|nr:hypothetical protein Glove_174g13 [Diversispora epigaea]